MGRLETIFDDESVTESGVEVDSIVEKALDSDQLRRILTRMIKGELSEQRLFEQLSDLTMDIETELESVLND